MIKFRVTFQNDPIRLIPEQHSTVYQCLILIAFRNQVRQKAVSPELEKQNGDRICFYFGSDARRKFNTIMILIVITTMSLDRSE